MALVAYDNSDSSDYEDDENEKEENIPEIELVEQKHVEVTNVFSLLPQPIRVKREIFEEDDEFLYKKEKPSDVKPKSRITIPSLKDFKDVEETRPSTKARIPNGEKSGLLSILPEPRNAVRSNSKALIPNVLAHRPQASTARKKNVLPSPAKITKGETKGSLITDYSDDSDNDEVQNDFFSMNKKEELPVVELPSEDYKQPTIETNTQPRSIESYFKKNVNDVATEERVEPIHNADYYSLNTEEAGVNGAGNSNEVVLDDEAILKLCGTRGKRKREEIQIVDVNQQEVLGNAREWLLKGLMDDTSKRQSASKKHGNEPTSQQRRKHQITYLAHKAKANEAELQNQWANNRMTKRQTQSKYGF